MRAVARAGLFRALSTRRPYQRPSLYTTNSSTHTTLSTAQSPRPTIPSSPPSPQLSPTSAASAQQHTSLTSFLAHARRTALSLTSTTYVGTVYEYTVLHALARFGLRLERTGGRDDRGVDLRGSWWVPDIHAEVGAPAGGGNALEADVDVDSRRGKWTPCVVQCKSLATSPSSSPSTGPGSPASSPSPISTPTRTPKKASPAFIRELEGATPPSTVSLLATPTSATKGIREALSRSRVPMVFVKCSPAGRVGQVLWNRAAGTGTEGRDGVLSGLEGVGMRHFDEALQGKEELHEECVLLSRGGELWDFQVSEGDAVVDQELDDRPGIAIASEQDVHSAPANAAVDG